jgi:hypothetical protein
MARIKCRTPSTGKGLRITKTNVSATIETIAEAPDFSVPDAGAKFSSRDPLDPARAIRPGEIFFLTPLAAKNKDSEDRWIEVSLLIETTSTTTTTTIELGFVTVPAGDTAFIPLQGRSLFKRLPDAANGDRLQVRAETTSTFDVWVAAEERLSSEHSGVE